MFDAEQYRSEAARAKTLADSLTFLLSNIYPRLTSRTAPIAVTLIHKSEHCEERANEEDPPEPDDDSSTQITPLLLNLISMAYSLIFRG